MRRPHHRIFGAFTAALCLALTSACAALRAPQTPMKTERETPHGADAAAGVVVFLPGYGDGPRHFERNGFVERVLALESGYDTISTDAHFGYYRTATLMPRLREDVVAPAIAEGYREIWLVGVSMGGLGALAYASRHPDEVTGVVLLAPYLGEPELVAEIEGAGGLADWDPGDPSLVDDERERFIRELWIWIKRQADRADGPAVYLGWGADDRLAPAARLAATAWPDDHHRTRRGGHGWVVWRPLFDDLAPMIRTVRP